MAIATAIGLVMLLIGSGCLSHAHDGGGLGDAVRTVVSDDKVGHVPQQAAHPQNEHAQVK